MSKYGIDISENQGTVKFSQIKAAGVEFAILRSIKKNLIVDKKFEEYYSGCRNAGILVGIYKYGYATTVEEARREAEVVLDLLACRNLDLPVFYDAEDASQRALPRETLTAIIRTFLEVIVAGGYQAAIYCNLDWYRNVIDITAFTDVDFWVARYGVNNGQPGEKPAVGEVCWQYTSRGSVPGISGNVDLNLLYKDYTATDLTPELPDGMEYFSSPRAYHNGSTPEPVYSSTDASVKIGSLDPWEECECIGLYNGMACVVYNITGKTVKKTGWVKWLGGLQ